MADDAETSSIPSKNEKTVIVRVKRKASQSRLEAFWLEINDRPLKRQLLDFQKLSLSDSSAKEEPKSKKVFVQHVETVSSSEVTVDVLQSIVPKSTDVLDPKPKYEERRHAFKMENQKHDQLLVKAKEKQEILSKNARFEQIWRRRKGKKEGNEALDEVCRLYDVVRVEAEETTNLVKEKTDTDLEDHKTMASYLPLLREFIPSAADEIESDIHTYMSEQDYVYDLYAVKDGPDITEEDDEDDATQLPLVQVDDDDDDDGPDESDNESDDSNAENNPLNDYPDEEEISEDEEVESKTSDDEMEESGSDIDGSPKSDHCSGDADLLSENGIASDDDVYGGGDDCDYYDDGGDGGGGGGGCDGDDDDWRWSYR